MRMCSRERGLQLPTRWAAHTVVLILPVPIPLTVQPAQVEPGALISYLSHPAAPLGCRLTRAPCSKQLSPSFDICCPRVLQVLLRSGTSVVQRGSPLVRLLLNANQVISSVVYVGPVGEFGRRAHRLVGLPVTYLGNLVSEYANGRVDDLYHYLTQVRLGALFDYCFLHGCSALLALRLPSTQPKPGHGTHACRTGHRRSTTRPLLSCVASSLGPLWGEWTSGSTSRKASMAPARLRRRRRSSQCSRPTVRRCRRTKWRDAGRDV